MTTSGGDEVFPLFDVPLATAARLARVDEKTFRGWLKNGHLGDPAPEASRKDVVTEVVPGVVEVEVAVPRLAPA